jgi:predicted phage-related endonuclease
MSNTSEPPIPVTTGIKRKAEPTYDELKDEVKRLRAKLKESRDQYNAVVPKYNILWRKVEKAKQDYSELAEKHQGLILDNNTLRSINFFSD